MWVLEGSNLRLEKSSAFFALEPQGSVGLRAWRRGPAGPKNGRRREGGCRDRFHAASFIPAPGVIGFRFLSYTSAGVLFLRF